MNASDFVFLLFCLLGGIGWFCALWFGTQWLLNHAVSQNSCEKLLERNAAARRGVEVDAHNLRAQETWNIK